MSDRKVLTIESAPVAEETAPTNSWRMLLAGAVTCVGVLGAGWGARCLPPRYAVEVDFQRQFAPQQADLASSTQLKLDLLSNANITAALQSLGHQPGESNFDQRVGAVRQYTTLSRSTVGDQQDRITVRVVDANPSTAIGLAQGLVAYHHQPAPTAHVVANLSHLAEAEHAHAAALQKVKALEDEYAKIEQIAQANYPSANNIEERLAKVHEQLEDLIGSLKSMPTADKSVITPALVHPDRQRAARMFEMNLQELLDRRTELLQYYTPIHPEVVKLNEAIEDYIQTEGVQPVNLQLAAEDERRDVEMEAETMLSVIENLRHQEQLLQQQHAESQRLREQANVCMQRLHQAQLHADQAHAACQQAKADADRQQAEAAAIQTVVRHEAVPRVYKVKTDQRRFFVVGSIVSSIIGLCIALMPTGGSRK